jgi:RHS repeat-associated protein
MIEWGKKIRKIIFIISATCLGMVPISYLQADIKFCEKPVFKVKKATATKEAYLYPCFDSPPGAFYVKMEDNVSSGVLTNIGFSGGASFTWRYTSHITNNAATLNTNFYSGNSTATYWVDGNLVTVSGSSTQGPYDGWAHPQTNVNWQAAENGASAMWVTMGYGENVVYDVNTAVLTGTHTNSDPANTYYGTVVQTWTLSESYSLTNLVPTVLGEFGDEDYAASWTNGVGIFLDTNWELPSIGSIANPVLKKVATTVTKAKYRLEFPTKTNTWYELSFEKTTTDKDGSQNGPPQKVVTKVLMMGTGGTTVVTGEFEPTAANTITNNQLASLGVPTIREFGSDCNSCKTGGGSPPIPGSGFTRMSSVDFEMVLGNTEQGQLAGYLKLHEEQPGLHLSDPISLDLQHIPDIVDATYDGAGRLQRVESPQMLALFTRTNDYRYQITCYPMGETGYLTNSAPISTWNFIDPDNGTNGGKRLLIVEVRGASSITNQFEWSSASNHWALTTGNGLSKQIKKSTWNGTTNQKVVTEDILNPQTDELISRKVSTYDLIAGQELVTIEVVGTGDHSRTNTFAYTTNGLLKEVRRWDGYWENLSYDSQSRLTQIISAFGTQAPTTNPSLARERTYSYDPVDAGIDDGEYMINQPRLEIEKVLGSEIARTYWGKSEFVEKEIRCVTPGADWDAADNLVTVTTNYSSGSFKGYLHSVTRPDGTMALYEYEFDGATNKVTTVYEGAPNATFSAVTNGVKTVTVNGYFGETISVSKVDIASNILIAQETYSEFDTLRRPGKVTYLNGSIRAFQYACCFLEAETDENGIETAYTYDALKRRTSVTRAGVSTINILDGASRTVAVWRQGTNSTLMLMSSNVFNTASELVTSYDALENETSYSRSVDGNGVRTETVTHPDSTTSVRMYFRDGSQKGVGGTAQHGVRWEYGVETEGGAARTYTKQLRLLTNAADSDEWVKTYTDAVGNSYKMLYPDGATNVTYFNDKGQAWKQVDADGVVTLFQYNAKGDQEYTVMDVDRDDTIDFSGTDRVTRSLSYATNAHGVDVLRSETWQWQTLGANTPVLLSTSDRSVETKESWQIAFGLTNYSIHVCVTNLVVCYSTNVSADGSYTVSMSQYGLPLSSTRYASNGVQVAQQSIGYDEFNRTITMTDARTGTITNTLDALGRTLTRTTPAPAPGQNPQTTQTDYDNRGRVWRVIEPDGGVVVTTYHPTGELKRKVGNRTYPVDYTYDYAGRMKTLKTWQDFDNDSGAAITTWNYDSQRGFMTSKRYADSKGPDYEYTLTGKLAKRTWARGVETDYTYNDAGDLETVDYSDSTPDVTYTYDRVGRKATVAQGSQDAVALHYTAAGQLAAEQHTSGLLAGVAITNVYDGLLRRTHLTVLTNGGSVYQALYGYDAASRMLTVSDGTNNATYGYVTNSSLVAEIAFKQNSTLRMTTTKQYDLLNRLTNISSTTASFTNSFAYLYNDANQRTKVTREDGSYWNYGYDDLGQVTSGKRYWADNTPVAGQQYEYDFDDIGNRKSTTSNAKPETRNSLYTANLLNQYTSRTVPGYADVLGTAHSNATVTVNYARSARKGEYWHKELSLNNQGQAVYAGVTNIAVLNDGANPDIVTTNTGKLFLPQTPEQFTYDDDGNLTGDGRWTYTWDGENRLIQLETKTGAVSAGTPKQKLEFAYDDQWRRIQKKVSDWNGSGYTATYTNRFAYDGWNLLMTLNPIASRQAYLWGKDMSGSLQGAGGAGGLIAIADSTSEGQFLAYDGSGNVLALANINNGNRDARTEYGPFGETVQSEGGWVHINPFRFSTKYQDQETSLLYYGFRYFNVSSGRWISRDPIGEMGGENILGFVANNPVGFLDILGLAGNSVDGAIEACLAMPTIAQRMHCLEQLLDTVSSPQSLNLINNALKSQRSLFNKFCHIFVPKHKLGNLVTQLGSKEAVYSAVVNAFNALPASVQAAGNYAFVTINGVNVTVQVTIVNGVPMVNNFWVP